jgi:hypothetical protein
MFRGGNVIKSILKGQSKYSTMSRNTNDRIGKTFKLFQTNIKEANNEPFYREYNAFERIQALQGEFIHAYSTLLESKIIY